MKQEIIKRLWRFVYSNSNEFPFNDGITKDYLSVQEKRCNWDATRLFGRFYWITKYTIL